MRPNKEQKSGMLRTEQALTFRFIILCKLTAYFLPKLKSELNGLRLGNAIKTIFIYNYNAELQAFYFSNAVFFKRCAHKSNTIDSFCTR